MKRHTAWGFSLIELMAVVAVISIFAAIAYPSYTSAVLKGRRAQGRTALVELLQQQERYLTQRNCYLGFSTSDTGVATAVAPIPSGACGGVTALSVPFKTYSGDSVANATYLLSAENCEGGGTTLSIAECVRVIARPRGTDDAVGDLSITSTGVKDCKPPPNGAPPPSSLCWP